MSDERHFLDLQVRSLEYIAMGGDARHRRDHLQRREETDVDTTLELNFMPDRIFAISVPECHSAFRLFGAWDLRRLFGVSRILTLGRLEVAQANHRRQEQIAKHTAHTLAQTCSMAHKLVGIKAP